MKKIRERILVMTVMYALLLVWMFGWKEILEMNFRTQMLVIMFGLAPLLETLFFQYLPNKLGERYNNQNVWMWISVACFIWWHKGNFPYAGWYFACLQGGYGLIFWYVNQKYGYWYAVFLHSKLNIFIYYFT